MSNTIEVLESITKKLYVTMAVSGFSAGEISVMDYDRMPYDSNGEYIHLHSTEVTIDLPKHSEDDLRKKAVSMLEAQKEKIRADSYVAERRVQDRIDDFLRITCVVGETNV